MVILAHNAKFTGLLSKCLPTKTLTQNLFWLLWVKGHFK